MAVATMMAVLAAAVGVAVSAAEALAAKEK